VSAHAHRIACVDVPALPLQLVLRAHPEWREQPVVVVEDDRPLATILWANRPARRLRIDRGTRFAEARTLSGTLHAEVVSAQAIDAAVDTLFERLLTFSPHVEPALDAPGLFWLDPNGLESLYGDLRRWARGVHRGLDADQWVTSIVVGFTRGPCLALARTRTGAQVVRDPDEERRLAARVPLARLAIAPRLHADLALLAVHDVGDLLVLPVGSLRKRYGEAAARLHDFLSGRTWTALVPRVLETPCIVELDVDPPDADHARILFGLRGVLHDAVAALARAHEAVTALSLVLALEHAGPNGERVHEERLETAAPTLDVVQLVELVRLRLAGCVLPAPVEHVRVTLERVRVHPRQAAMLFDGPKKRDLEAAARALARLRASFGVEAVTRARPQAAHLPEARYRYEPVRAVQLPRAHAQSGGTGGGAHEPMAPPLVRRVFATPMPLPPMPAHEPERWLGRHGAIAALHGPHRIAGGWWSPRGRRERDYYFAETRRGEILWIYYDRPKRRWFLQGIVD